MAGSSVTITFSKVRIPFGSESRITKAVIDWVADDTDGSVPATDFAATDMGKIFGKFCILGVTDPGATAPTDNYDIEILDEYGADIFGGNLLDRDTANAEQAVPSIGLAYGGRLCAGNWSFKLTNNSVNDATGKCILYFET